jgi:hypothetical protein
MDRFIQNMSIEFPISYVNAVRAVGFEDYNDPTTTIQGFPFRAIRHYDARKDHENYGGALGAVFARLRSSANTRGTDWGQDTDIQKHVSYRGSITYKGETTAFNPVRSVIDRAGVRVRRVDPTAPENTSMSVLRKSLLIENSDVLPEVYPVNGLDEHWGYQDRQFKIDDLGLSLATDPENPFIEGNPNQTINALFYSNFRVESLETPHGLSWTLTYVFRNVAYGPEPHPVDGLGLYSDSTYEVQLDFFSNFSYDPRYGEDLIDGVFPINVELEAHVGLSYKLIAHSYSHPIPPSYYWRVESGLADHVNWIQSATHFSRAAGTPPYSQRTNRFLARPSYVDASLGAHRMLKAFEMHIDSIRGDLVTASCFSANDCLSMYDSDLNMFESVPELLPMLRGLADVGGFALTAKRLANGDVSATEKVVDHLAESYLTYQYGIAPSISDAEEANRVARRVVDGLTVAASGLPTTLYGVFNFDIPTTIPELPGSVRLVARTKMELRQSAGSLLAHAMSLDEVGLLPKLSTVYELFPFSFVADWFGRFGDRFETLEQVAVRALLPVVFCEHTYTVTYRPSQWAIALWGLESDDFSCRYYWRDRSLFQPAFKPSRFDFQPPSGLKGKTLAAGALLWVLK